MKNAVIDEEHLCFVSHFTLKNGRTKLCRFGEEIKTQNFNIYNFIEVVILTQTFILFLK